MRVDTPKHGQPRLVFVTNICPHYRVRTFETLSKYYDAVFYFYSTGDEWYWQQKHGTRTGNFEYEYLRGRTIFGTRINLNLLPKLLQNKYDVYIKCINGRFALPITYLAARIRKKPFVLWTGVWTKIDTTFHRMIYPLTRYIYKHSDAIVTYGRHVKEFLVNNGIPEERIFVAPHAVDNELYMREVSQAEVSRLRQALKLSACDQVILYLGRLEHSKGVRFLLDAFRRLLLPNCVLVFAGEGGERDYLLERVKFHGIGDKTRFVGYVKPEDTPPYYALASVLVVPSITTVMFKEPWGLVVNEAMNQGCPVIATEAVGAAAGGLLRNNVNGLIVPEKDALELAAAIKKIITDSTLRDELSQNARQTIAAWDNESMIKGFRTAIDFVFQKTP